MRPDSVESAFGHRRAGHGCGERAIALEPGAVRVDTIRIGGPGGWQSGTDMHFGELEGQFRLVAVAFTCMDEETGLADPECRLPRSDWPRSNVFEVRLDKGPELPQAELISTDRDAYIAEPEDVEPGSAPMYGFDVIARFENTTGETIYLDRCGELLPTHGASRVGPESPEYETSAYALGPRLEQECRPNPSTLLPGAERTDTLRIHGPGPGARRPGGEPTGELEGQFVLKYIAGLCLKEQADGTTTVGCLLHPDNLPRSNPFEVQLAE